MKRFIITGALASLSLVSIPGAFASDYGSGVVYKDPAPEYTEVEYGSGWYLRGDISFNSDGRNETGRSYTSQYGASLPHDYSDAWGIKAGFGYIFNPYLRMDFTAEHMLESEFDGSFSRTFTGVQEQIIDVVNNVTAMVPVSDIGGFETVDASYSATNFMVNGYFDIGRFGRLKPYVGAGLGVARIEYQERRTATCQPNITQACGSPAPGNQGETVADVVIMDEEEIQYTHAYQLMAGTAISITDQLDLDVGYSYFETGDGPEINYADGTAINIDGFSVHKFNVGLRYEIR